MHYLKNNGSHRQFPRECPCFLSRKASSPLHTEKCHELSAGQPRLCASLTPYCCVTLGKALILSHTSWIMVNRIQITSLVCCVPPHQQPPEHGRNLKSASTSPNLCTYLFTVLRRGNPPHFSLSLSPLPHWAPLCLSLSLGKLFLCFGALRLTK